MMKKFGGSQWHREERCLANQSEKASHKLNFRGERGFESSEVATIYSLHKILL